MRKIAIPILVHGVNISIFGMGAKSQRKVMSTEVCISVEGLVGVVTGAADRDMYALRSIYS